MVVLNKSGFRLPRVEKDKFVLLLRLGLDYNREKGCYSIKNYNNIDRLRDVLVDILKSEVSFTQSCISCGTDFACSTCKYTESCATKDLPFSCVCPKCLKDGNSIAQKVL